MKKFICLILIISILLCGFVPCYAVGDSLVISGLGTLASSLGFSSVAPLIGIAGVLVAGGLALTQTNFLSAIKGYLGSFYKPSQLTNLTDLGYTPSTTVSNNVATSVNHYLDLVTSMGLAESVIASSNGRWSVDVSDWQDLTVSGGVFFNSQTTWFNTNIPNLVFTPLFLYNDSNNSNLYFIYYNTLTGELFSQFIQTIGTSTTYTSLTDIYLSVNSSGYVTLHFKKSTSPNTDLTITSFLTANSGNSGIFRNNEDYFISNFGRITPTYESTGIFADSSQIKIKFYPNANFNTLATGYGSPAYTPTVLDTSAIPVTDETVISVPQTWEYDDNEDVLTIPNVSGGTLKPSDVLNNPAIPSEGTIEWLDTPLIPEDDLQIPEWTYKIPLLGTIAKLLQWLGNLLKQLGNWLTSLWDTISGWFADIKQLLLDIFNTLKNLDLSRFVSAVFSFITGYTLYNTLFSAYLPQCIAVVLWAGWLVLMCFWILRLLLNRG